MPDFQKRVQIAGSISSPQILSFLKDISAILWYFFIKSFLVARSYLVRDAEIKSLIMSDL